jgi:hypothetical protein
MQDIRVSQGAVMKIRTLSLAVLLALAPAMSLAAVAVKKASPVKTAIATPVATPVATGVKIRKGPIPRRFAVTADVFATGAYSEADLPADYGMGFSLLGEYRPVTVVSFAVGVGFTNYFGGGDMQTSWIDMGGRIYPMGTQEKGEAYLQGGMGMAPLMKTLDRHWQGRFHGTVGTGYRRFLGGNKALDMGVQYDLFSPEDCPLNSVGFKVGFSMSFGKKVSQEDPRLIPSDND